MSLAQTPTKESTIAALSTPPGVGAIAIVRLSGPDARAIADRVFRGSEKLAAAKPQTVCHGFAVGGSGERLDEVLATVFVAPKSYTGEDLVELSCHGGQLPAALVLEAVLQAGALAAGPGEFTKRAFLSGKLDLSQAEAVAEIVAARSRAGLKAALSQLDGALSSRVRTLRDGLVGLLAELEARLDFSEDVEDPIDSEALSQAVESARERLGQLLEGASLGRLMREGARVVIAGKPNVGKSSLLNAIVGRDRAIVTPVPGTTRDTIEDWVELEGVLLTLADTAGLRSPGDEIEAEGVRRTRELIRESQLVIAVVEMPSSPTTKDISLIGDLAAEAPVIPVVNKTDLGGDSQVWTRALAGLSVRGEGAAADRQPSRVKGSLLRGKQLAGPNTQVDAGPRPDERKLRRGEDSLPEVGAGVREETGADRKPAARVARDKESAAFPVLPCAFVSARTGDGVSALKARIVEALCGRAGSLEAYGDEVLLTNVRHVEALRRADQALGRAQSALEEGLTEEILAFEVRGALEAMGEISGESVTEDVLETIFSRFCVGK